MNRETLTALGLTDEQIEKIMAENGKDIQKANASADKFKEKASKADELQKQLDEINEKNLSDTEKAQKALELANSRIAELEKAQALAQKKASVAEKFKLDSKKVDEIFAEDGSFDLDKLGAIISEKEEAAKNAAIQSIANGSINPGGGSVGGGKEKTESETIAENYGKVVAEGNKAAQGILDSYIN